MRKLKTFLILPVLIGFHFNLHAETRCAIFLPTFLKPYLIQKGSTANEALNLWGQSSAREILIKSIDGKPPEYGTRMVDVVWDMLQGDSPFARMMREVAPEFLNRATGEFNLLDPVTFNTRYQAYLEKLEVPEAERFGIGAVVVANPSLFVPEARPIRSALSRVLPISSHTFKDTIAQRSYDKSTADYRSHTYGDNVLSRDGGLEPFAGGNFKGFETIPYFFTRDINFFDVPLTNGVIPVTWNAGISSGTPIVFHQLFYAAAWTVPAFRQAAIGIMIKPRRPSGPQRTVADELFDHFEKFSTLRHDTADRILAIWRDAGLPMEEGVPVLFTKAEAKALSEFKNSTRKYLEETSSEPHPNVDRIRTDYDGIAEHAAIRDRFIEIVGDKRAKALLEIREIILEETSIYGAYIADGVSFRNLSGVKSSNWGIGHGRFIYQISGLDGLARALSPDAVNSRSFSYITLLADPTFLNYAMRGLGESIVTNPVE